MPSGLDLITARGGGADIDEIERVAALHWRAGEEERLGDWLLRAAGGFTGRANSALAIGDPGLPVDDALATVTSWYQARGLRPMIAVPQPLAAPASLDTLLKERAWPSRAAPAYVMTTRLSSHSAASSRPLPRPEGTRERFDPEPDDAWLAMYHYRGQELPPIARDLLLSAAWQSFASIRDASGEPVAIARLSVAGGWAGITAVEVSAACRRQGLGTLITRAACAQAASRGIDQVFLQVEVENAPALALYERCGFRYSHKYAYRLAPES
jgi:ribosomal protein S18 acetylase RimI-like enzyme